MRREAERTLQTLSFEYQRNITEDDYEVVVVDNGSSAPLDDTYVSRFGKNFRLFQMPEPTQSPARALNFGARVSRGSILISMIDGARMVSPGCISWTIKAFDAFGKVAAIVPSWHLGPDVQNESVAHGYDQLVEDELLASVDWRRDGYKLFKLCERLDPSSEGAAWFLPVSESNFIAVARDTFEQLGGFEERFTSRGGGAVNLDFFKRIVEEMACPIVSLVGEGTFHQFHGGVSTNVKAECHPWPAIDAEYKSIRGIGFERPKYQPILMGSLVVMLLDSWRETTIFSIRMPMNICRSAIALGERKSIKSSRTSCQAARLAAQLRLDGCQPNDESAAAT